jgi:DNA-binding transcriptional LysR family regulator
MIKLQQLAHAVALSRYGSFNRAAEAHHISQPAFSRSIRSLEDALGVLLFDRQGSAVMPTLYGETLLRRADAILGDTNELEREIALLKGLEAGSFAVAMGAYAAELSGGRAVGELTRQHPNLRCQVRLGTWRDVADLVSSRRVDLAIAEISILRGVERLQVESIGTHQMVFYCRREHPLLGRGPLSNDDLDEFPLVSIRIPPRGARLLRGKWSLDPDTGDLIPQVEVDDLATAHAVVLASDAFGIATPLQIEPWLNRGALCVLSYPAPWLRLDYGFIYLKGRLLSPAAQRFMQIVTEIEAEISRRNRELFDKMGLAVAGA